jgi:hypothetical protein
MQPNGIEYGVATEETGPITVATPIYSDTSTKPSQSLDGSLGGSREVAVQCAWVRP